MLTVAYIVPGSGNTFYCENCLRDCAAVKALRQLGHDVVLVPLYLPLFADEHGLSRTTPVFFGGINVYLQQRLGLFRHTPRWLDRLFDWPPLLRLAARRAASTRATGLGAMTLSMLHGVEGRQNKEVDRLVDWLAELRPQVVHFSNALLLGLVPELKRRLPGLAVVCSLQDEDTWLDALDAPYDAACRTMIGKLARQVEAFVAVSHHYGQRMLAYLNLPADRLQVIPPGLEPGDYPPVDLATAPPRIGYLSRIAAKLGAGELADAFIELARRPGLDQLELLYGGGTTDDDQPFVKQLGDRFQRAGLANRVRFVDGLDLEARRHLLAQLTVLSVPMPEGEAFGTFIVEALLSGVPVVQPDVGGFGEIVRDTGGGLLYDSSQATGLVDALAQVVGDPAQARQLGSHGRAAAIDLYSAASVANRLANLYLQLTDPNRPTDRDEP